MKNQILIVLQISLIALLLTPSIFYSFVQSAEKESLTQVDSNYQMASKLLQNYNYEQEEKLRQLAANHMGLTGVVPNSDTELGTTLREACEHITSSIKSRPRNPQYYVLRSKIYHAGHMNLDALEDLCNAIAVAPKDASLYYLRAKFWSNQCIMPIDAKESNRMTYPDIRKALLAIAHAGEYDEHKPVVGYQFLAWDRARKQAAIDCSKAIALDPNNTSFRKLYQELQNPITVPPGVKQIHESK